MFITKKALPRRTFLRGVGTALALPYLDAMVPALSAAPARPPRFAFFHFPNGAYTPHFHPAVGTGNRSLTGMTLPRCLRPLEAFRDQMVVFSGLCATAADDPTMAGGNHERAAGAYLSGMTPKQGADMFLGKTLDQYISDKVGEDTPLRSLQLSTETDVFGAGAGGNGYVSAYTSSMSWAGPQAPVPMEANPRRVFEKLFGDGSAAPERIAQLRRNRSVLDSVTEEIDGIQKQIGAGDRTVINEYFESIREVERVIQKAETQLSEGKVADPASITLPYGIPERYEDHAMALFSLQALAFQGDITRVSCFRLARDNAYAFLGVPEGHHASTHHQGDPRLVENYARVLEYNTTLFARLAEKLRATQDGDGTLLDRSLLMYGSAMGDGDLHDKFNVPLVLVGGGNGTVKGNRHIEVEPKPLLNVGLRMLHDIGSEVQSIGDTTGPLAEL
jgi:hypothetical protein